eukprot:scaffold5880_cov32-Tisochrysis_lutea.AAC.13
MTRWTPALARGYPGCQRGHSLRPSRPTPRKIRQTPRSVVLSFRDHKMLLAYFIYDLRLRLVGSEKGE